MKKAVCMRSPVCHSPSFVISLSDSPIVKGSDKNDVDMCRVNCSQTISNQLLTTLVLFTQQT